MMRLLSFFDSCKPGENFPLVFVHAPLVPATGLVRVDRIGGFLCDRTDSLSAENQK